MTSAASPHPQALDMAIGIARSLRQRIAPHLDLPGAGDISGVASSGDTTFAVDVAAEAALKEVSSRLGIPVACYSEDEGLKEYGTDPQWLLIVDPIDGTRPAAAGLEACCVSVAVCRFTPEAHYSDVVAGAVYELRRDRLYYASRGGGSFMETTGQTCQLQSVPPPGFSQLRWTLEVVARPSHLNFQVAASLIDATALEGGFYVLNSSAFTLCRIAAGSLSGMMDISARLLRDVPGARDEICSIGGGRLMGLWGYDIAAAALIAEEAGCTLSDAWGRPMDSLILTSTDDRSMASCVCAAGRQHHQEMLDLINRGFASL